jgi:hypothetical protein
VALASLVTRKSHRDMQHMNLERLARKLLGHKRGRRTLSQEQQEAERKRGKALARFHAERQGKIGRIERQIHIAVRPTALDVRQHPQKRRNVLLPCRQK